MQSSYCKDQAKLCFPPFIRRPSSSIFRRKLANKENINTSSPHLFFPHRKDSYHLPDTGPCYGQLMSSFFTLWIIASPLRVTIAVFLKTLPIMFYLMVHKLYFTPKLTPETNHNYQAFNWQVGKDP